MPEESKEQIRARELKTMIEELTACIDKYEKKESTPGWGTNIQSINARAHREEYAGWIAQRNLYKRLLSDLRPYFNGCSEIFDLGIRP